MAAGGCSLQQILTGEGRLQPAESLCGRPPHQIAFVSQQASHCRHMRSNSFVALPTAGSTVQNTISRGGAFDGACAGKGSQTKGRSYSPAARTSPPSTWVASRRTPLSVWRSRSATTAACDGSNAPNPCRKGRRFGCRCGSRAHTRPRSCTVSAGAQTSAVKQSPSFCSALAAAWRTCASLSTSRTTTMRSVNFALRCVFFFFFFFFFLRFRYKNIHSHV